MVDSYPSVPSRHNATAAPNYKQRFPVPTCTLPIHNDTLTVVR